MIGRSPLPVTFRYLLLRTLMRSIEAGESLAVVGVASVGKSNVVHALQQPNIQAAHWGQRGQQYLVVWVDSNDLTEISPWHFFELLLYRLSVHARQAKLPRSAVTHLEELHQTLATQKSATMAQRHFESGIRWLGQTHQLRVVLLLDEFDLLFQELPARLFINLRSLRDKNKYSLVYLLFLRQELAALRPDLTEVEAFAELFQAKSHYLQPYDLAGTEMMLDRLSERQQMTWPAEHTLTLFDESGGHSGLLKLLFNKILPDLKAGKPLRFDTVAADPEVLAESQKIWDSLSDPERTLLQQVAQTGFPKGVPQKWSALAQQLRDKGLLRFDNKAPRLFSALFAHFVKQTIPKGEGHKGFRFDIKSQTCRINDREIILPDLPAKLLEMLYGNAGQLCHKIEILHYLYPDEDHSQLARLSDDPRLYDVVKNLRSKIEPNPRKPRYVKTVRGLGFKLDI